MLRLVEMRFERIRLADAIRMSSKLFRAARGMMCPRMRQQSSWIAARHALLVAIGWM